MTTISPSDGMPRIEGFHGELREIVLRKTVNGKHFIYDAVFSQTGEDAVPVQIHRNAPTSLHEKIGRTFDLSGATFRFEHGEPPSVKVQCALCDLRGAVLHNRPVSISPDVAADLLDEYTSMQIQLAQTRLVIQASTITEVKP